MEVAEEAGGFVLEEGMLRPAPGPGLGITWEEKAGIGKAFVGLEQP